ncbi:Hexuronate transporter [Lacunisphaera limnophila]|uniref:Hexuronate transporter n=1 Tax=Lacunisphaera limnophila TaxID=1838286 RepID=A0A1D8AUE6_9BACT|nr:MFS transporter [Lacunisphaera limnophila]AOS44486.1 Hexuronate transporter [Lacunisphaera limnophila]
MSKLNDINEQVGKYRWTICSLVFFATTVNYLDRNVLGLLKPVLSADGVFGPDKATQELNYSTVVICFQLAYAIGMVLAGRLIDWVGTKAGYAYSLIGWSIAAIGHAFGHHTWSFGFWRAALGFTESGNFPAANKTIAEWFPKKERALATGLYNSGANVGAIVAPLSVPYIAEWWGWEWAFILTGVVGLIWIYFWYTMYDSPAAKLAKGQLSQGEYDFIHSDKDEQAEEASAVNQPKVSWGRLLTFRQTWAFVLGKFLTDPIWWFYMFWLPAFLNEENGRKIAAYLAAHPDYTGDKSAIPGIISWTLAVAVVYTIATFGSIFGGWLPKYFVNGGMDPNKARKLSMFIFSLFPLTVLAASRLGEINTWLAVGTIAIACAAHQAWSANIFTTVSDMFPKRTVASVTGIGGMAGGLGGILIARAAGLLLAHYIALDKVEVGYGILFVICGSAYIVAWVLMHLLVPKFKQIQL